MVLFSDWYIGLNVKLLSDILKCFLVFIGSGRWICVSMWFIGKYSVKFLVFILFWLKSFVVIGFLNVMLFLLWILFVLRFNLILFINICKGLSFYFILLIGRLLIIIVCVLFENKVLLILLMVILLGNVIWLIMWIVGM